MLVGRWESQRGAHWVELHADRDVYSYSGNGCVGCLGVHASPETAVAEIQRRVDRGQFQPDAAKTQMRRMK